MARGIPRRALRLRRLSSGMPDADEKLTHADPADLADVSALALRYCGRKRVLPQWQTLTRRLSSQAPEVE